MAFAYLPAPTQSTPSNGASGVSTAPTFSWSAVSGADAGYRIMVASSSGVLPTDPTVSTCSGCVINDTPSGTSYTPAAGVLSGGTTYYWEVHARSSTTYGLWSDIWSFTTASPVPLPTATTNSATKVTWSSATLNGTVNPNGSSTTAYFQWGTSTSYGNTTSSQSIGSGASSVAISANLSSLTAGTTYHFRMVATNSAGTAYGADATFATVLEGVDYLRTQSPSTDRCIRNAGKFFVGRYYDDSGGKSAKCLVQEEAAQLHKAGLKIGTFYETCGGSTCCGCPGPSYFRYNQGVYDAQQAKARAKDAGQAAGAPIFFAVDYDATNVDLSRGIAQYFKGVASGMKGAYPIGVYGSYSVIEYAQANWPNVTHYWQTYAWSYGKRSDYAMAYQYLNGYVLCGVNLDLDREYQEVTW
ncbi:MAG: glycoside hydrolase domain-containing protein [Candidatus Binataceae bacterium]